MNFRSRLVRAYRFRVRFRPPREPSRTWPVTDAGVDPRAKLRRGTFAASDGQLIPYRLWRPRAARAAVLLLHGAFDYAAAFDEIGPKLAARGFAALAIDQRGFGATATRGRWAGGERMARDAAEATEFLLDRTRARVPLFILGESIGGAVAIHAAASSRIPQLKGLVLAAPGALASRLRQRLLNWLAAVTCLFGRDTEFVIERMSGWELTPAAAIRLIGDPLVMRRIRPQMLAGMAELAMSAVEEARAVVTPALVLVAARDELVRVDCIRRLYENLAGDKTWLVMAGAPHLLLHWRRANEVLREATSWMGARMDAEFASTDKDRQRFAPSRIEKIRRQFPSDCAMN